MSPREVFTDRLRKFHVPPSRGELPSAHDPCEPSSRCFADARRGGRTRNCRALERGAGARVHAESAAASLRRPNLRADPHPRRLPVLALAEDQRQPRAHLQGGDEHGHLPLRGLKARPGGSLRRRWRLPPDHPDGRQQARLTGDSGYWIVVSLVSPTRYVYALSNGKLSDIALAQVGASGKRFAKP